MTPRAEPACDFTLHHYAEILRSAIRSGFEVHTCLAYVDAPLTERVLVLRHDVDWALEPAGRMAELEWQLGVRATYFVRVRSQLYDPRSPSNKSILRHMSERGFEIGLHYDAEADIATDRVVLERIIGRQVCGVAQHMPRRRGKVLGTNDGVTSAGPTDAPGVRYDAYGPPLIETLRYVSDSNQRWRHDCPHLMIGSETKLYLLVHPVWWSPLEGVTVEQIIEELRSGN